MALRMVKYLPSDLLKDFQIVHSRVRQLDPDLIKVLVCHDLASDPEVKALADPEYRKQFAKIVFVSNWQAQQYNQLLGVPYSEFVVIPNMIEPFDDTSHSKPFDRINIIYHTTPHRGLELVAPAFEAIKREFPDAYLDVFSSFKIYGWESRDQPYQQLFDRLKSTDGVTFHGTQPNDVVRKHLTQAHIFAYPSIWPETSCIAAIEALCAGCTIVHPNYAALPETCGSLTQMYQWDEDVNRHVNRFYQHLRAAVFTTKTMGAQFQSVVQQRQTYYNGVHKWSNQRWIQLLTELKNGTPGTS